MPARRRSNAPPFLTKPGRHGTLYRFKIRYTDKYDQGFPPTDWFTWAYDANHAEERFFDTEDDGWKILSGPERVRESSGARDRGRSAPRRDDVRPVDVTRIAREIDGYTRDDRNRLYKAVSSFGWELVEENRYSGAWWIRKGDHEVMIVFGGPRGSARAFSWRPVGGATTRI